MAKQHTPTNIKSYKRKWNFNIGVFLFGAIFLYLMATIIIYATSRNVSVYEVRQGSIIRDPAFTGFVLRNEEAIPAETTGYLNYYVIDKGKVALGSKVYALSPTELVLTDNETSEDSNVDIETQHSIRIRTKSFLEQFDKSQFATTYTFKNDIESELYNEKRDNRLNQLNGLLEASENISVSTAPLDGVVVYSTDGYEGLTIDDVNKNHFQRKDYLPIQTSNNEKINMGTMAYKLITDETWNIIIELEPPNIDELAETTRVQVRFIKDNTTMWADFNIIFREDGSVYGCLTFNKAMIRYASDRYLNIELVLENQTGLKIPKSAASIKEFFVIPETFLTVGGNGKETGVMLQDKSGKYVFEKTIVRFRDEKEGLVYFDTNDFAEDSILLKPNSTSETLLIREKRELEGVYNINKGYAVFRQIQVISESEEYYIVKEGNRYSISNFDHIALDGSTIKENDLVF